MPGILYQYLSDDHDKMDGLLTGAVASAGEIDMALYSAFRKRLLRHISMEEKIVLPAIANWQGGKKAAVAERLRLDHGAIVSLLVPPPSASIIRTLRSIFAVHNPLEEGDGGLYQLFEELAGGECERMLAELKAAPDVAVLPHNDQPGIIEVTKRAVSRAGYKYDDG